MAEIIRMPRMSDTMEEGNIVGWLKKVGDKVEPGDVLAEVETDKATMELESYFEGTLLYIGIKEGPVPVNGLLAIIGDQDEDVESILKGLDAGESSDPTPATENKPEETKVEEKAPVAETTGQSDDTRVKSSPLARKIAKEEGIDLSKVTGSGEGGRIVKQDVEKAKSSHKEISAPTATHTAAIAPAEGNYEEVPVSQMRKVIARRLGESKFSAPHFYLTIEINMDNAIETRKKINEIADVKISFNDLVIKAAATALSKHPAVNSSWLGDKIRYNKDINIGVAVAVEDGLLVPVVHNANQKSLSHINTEVKTLAGKAKEKKLQPNEMTGNTFTISNLGMFDIDEFTAIINPPDACILAVGSISQKPVIRNNEIVPGNIMKVTLSCDHRVVDGATGAQFLQTFKTILEDPIRIIV